MVICKIFQVNLSEFSSFQLQTMVLNFWSSSVGTVRETENSLKNLRIGAVLETSAYYDTSIFETIIWSLINNENGDS